MVIKKYILIIFGLIAACTLHAQDTVPSLDKQLTREDSLLIDSLMVSMTEVQEDTLLYVMPIEELEDYIVSLQDTFFSYKEKSFSTDEYYSFGNSHYIIPAENGSIEFFYARLDNYAQPRMQFYSLLNYFVFNNRNGMYRLTPLRNSFRALLTDVQYGNGDYNNETKRIGFIKNKFLDIASFQLYAHSGEHSSPWDEKCYYDNFIFHINKDIQTESLTTHSFSYTFFKLFSAQETYNVFNPSYTDLEEKFYQKTENISNIAAATLFDKILTLSGLHQYNKEVIIGGDKNTLNRYQFNIGIDLPMEEYATNVLLRGDILDLDNAYYKGWLHDYLVRIELNSPGIFADFYSIKIINDVIFSEKPDTTFILPELVFEIPLLESVDSELSVGVRRKEKNFYYDGEYALENKAKIIFTDGTLFVRTNILDLQLDAFFQEIRNDGQWQWLTSSPYYKNFNDYNIYGASLEAEFGYEFLTVDSRIRFSGTFSQRPNSLLNYPAYKAKIEWTNRRHFPHMNFIYANASASYLGNMLNIKGTKIDHQVFCSAEVGVSIKRFLIYLKLTNLLDNLDSNYFIDTSNEVNPFGVGFGVQWNFIN